MRTRIPEIDACQWDIPPVSRELFICYHPQNCAVNGWGRTKEEAYRLMLWELYEAVAAKMDAVEALQYFRAIRITQEEVRDLCSQMKF